MRAKVNPELRAGIDGVAPGAEGEFIDNRATRSLVEAGVLLPLEELPSEPPPRVKRAPVVAGPDAADLAALAAKLEAENAALRRANDEGAALVAKLEARVAELSAKKAKKSEEPPPPPPEG